MIKNSLFENLDQDIINARNYTHCGSYDLAHNSYQDILSNLRTIVNTIEKIESRISQEDCAVLTMISEMPTSPQTMVKQKSLLTPRKASFHAKSILPTSSDKQQKSEVISSPPPPSIPNQPITAIKPDEFPISPKSKVDKSKKSVDSKKKEAEKRVKGTETKKRLVKKTTTLKTKKSTTTKKSEKIKEEEEETTSVVEVEKKEEENKSIPPVINTKIIEQEEEELPISGAYVESHYTEYKQSSEQIRSIIDDIENRIYVTTNNIIKLDDLVGYDDIKRSLYESIIFPMLLPDSFKTRSVLLFGPKGTGKTTIAESLANESCASYFYIDLPLSSTLEIKDDKVDYLKYLFKIAKFYSPSIIFIDNIDELFINNKNNEMIINELNEGMKSIRNTENGKSVNAVTVIATTSKPEKLNEMTRRRFDKLLYVDLPEKECRKRIFKYKIQTSNHILKNDIDYDKLSELTNGYSCGDINQICYEALRSPALEALSHMSEEEIQNRDLEELDDYLMKIPVTMNHFVNEVNNLKPSVSKDIINKYNEWIRLFNNSVLYHNFDFMYQKQQF